MKDNVIRDWSKFFAAICFNMTGYGLPTLWNTDGWIEVL
jgi:hypothetical protein